MGSKHRRKSKSSRRQPASAREKVAANDQDINTLDVDENVAEGGAALVVDEPPQEQLNPATDRVDEAVTLANPGVVPTEAPTPLVDEEILPMNEAKKVLELFVVSLLAANISPLAAFCNRRSRELRLTELEDLLFQQLDKTDYDKLDPRQRRALRSICPESNGTVDTAPLIELVGAATFRVEILEFQIRQAILKRSSSKSRGKVDIQRAVTKLSASFPQKSAKVTTEDFETMLEEKLGVSTGSNLLSRVTFARIAGLPFTQRLPKHMQSPKEAFFAAIEVFVADKSLSLDSVEGQLRHLVSNHADLHASFKALDSDDSGAITVDEIVVFLQREAHMQYPRDVIAAFVKRFDVDGDGTLSIDEFVAFVSPKQFGIQVLTPFGIFYHAADRHESMKEVVAKIKTRMFWMQHNDLFATSTKPVYKPPLKLKVSDHFILTHHYGKLRLRYKDNDPIASVLKNGEMVVLVMEPIVPLKPLGEDGRLPEFEYRLKPNIKRCIPPLMSWTIGGIQSDVSSTTSAVDIKKSSLYSRKVSRAGGASDQLSVSKRSEEDEDDEVSVCSVRSLASNQGGNASTVMKPIGQVKAAKSSRPAVVKHANRETTASQRRSLGTRDEEPLATTPSRQEPLVVAVEAQASLPFSAETSIDSVTEHEYYEAASSADEDDTEEQSANVLQHFSQGDECGPPQELGDETVDCDEEEPPPAYDS